jgi:hypothetical protein
MSAITDKLRSLIVETAPYDPDNDPPVIVFHQEKQIKTTANGHTKRPQIHESLKEILEYVESLEEELEELYWR